MILREQQLLDRYLQHLAVNRGRARGTVDAYYRQLVRLSAFLSERGISLVTATQQDLEEFSGIHLHELGVSPRSRKLAIAATRGLYAWLHRQGSIQADPAAGLHYPKAGRKLPYSMPLKAAEALIMQCDLHEFTGVRNAAIIAVMTGCGLRVSGVSQLNESDIVADADEDGKESVYLRVTEKGDRVRLVPAPDETYLLLRCYLGHEELESIDRDLPNGDRVLFVNTRTPIVQAFNNVGEFRRLSVTGIRRMLVRLGEQAGIPRKFLHPHALRHLYGTELTEAGVDVLSIQTLMGHRDANSTKIYAHLSTRRLRKAVDRGGPMSKIKTPVSGLTHMLRRG